MDIFSEILNEMNLLMEDASVSNITNAINGLHPAWITYDDGEGGGGKNKRLIYPVAYGISTAGNPVVRAYQAQGSTKRGAPNWKLFRIDRVKNWRTINSKEYNPDELNGFNKEGDDQIETLYTIAPIGNAKKISAEKQETSQGMPVTSGPITKDDILKYTNPSKFGDESQEKSKSSASDTVNSIMKHIVSKNVDNTKEKEDTNNSKLLAPETEPITKNDLVVNEPEQEEQPEQNEPETSDIGVDEPVTKDELSGNEDENEKPGFVDKVKDLMGRMDAVEKENKEDKID